MDEIACKLIKYALIMMIEHELGDVASLELRFGKLGFVLVQEKIGICPNCMHRPAVLKMSLGDRPVQMCNLVFFLFRCVGGFNYT